LSPTNAWVIGFTKEPATESYWLVLNDTKSALDSFINRTQQADYNVSTQYQGQIKWIDFQELTDLKKLSSGAFGTVYSATWNLSSPSNSKEAKSQQVAIKYMDKCNFQLETLFHEVRNLYCNYTDFIYHPTV